jgi:hypothetical protein
MKLRIHDHSLRVRLSDADLQRCLEDGGIVQSLGETGPGTGLRCSLEIVPSASPPAVEMTGRGIRVLLAREDARMLRGNPEETLTRAIPAGDAPALTICIEMDGPETCPAKATNRLCPLRRPS